MRKISADRIHAVLKDCSINSNPSAFYGFSGAAAAYLVKIGHLKIVERRKPFGARYVVITDAGRQALDATK